MNVIDASVNKPEGRKVWCCCRCKGTNVLQDAYVDVNDQSVVSTFDSFVCNDCEEECDIEERPVEAKDIE